MNIKSRGGCEIQRIWGHVQKPYTTQMLNRIEKERHLVTKHYVETQNGQNKSRTKLIGGDI